jgi:hypothetical protein
MPVTLFDSPSMTPLLQEKSNKSNNRNEYCQPSGNYKSVKLIHLQATSNQEKQYLHFTDWRKRLTRSVADGEFTPRPDQNVVESAA